MAYPQRVNSVNLQFRIETLMVKNGRRLGRVRPDENGYYDMPLAVLGIVTDNNTYYEVDSFVDQITNKNSFVNKMVTDGKLYGEYGHPNLTGLKDNDLLTRLMTVDEKLQSHHIGALYTGATLESGGVMLNGKIKPHGPYKQALLDSLEDPCVNTSFSLRSFSSEVVDGGVKRRKMKRLVTFDYVCAGGYNQASKRYSDGGAAAESVDFAYTSDLSSMCSQVSLETFSNTELNELFGAKVVQYREQSFTVMNGAVYDKKSSRPRALYQMLMSGSQE